VRYALDQRILQRMYTLQKAGMIASGALYAWTVWSITVRLVEHGSGNVDLLPLLALVGPAVLLVMAIRPVLAAIAVIGFAFVNSSLIPPLTEIGELSFRYSDVLYMVLTLVVLTQTSVQEHISFSVDFKKLLIPLFPFLLYVGVSLIKVNFTLPYFLPFCGASYLRLILTVLLTFLMYLSIKNGDDMKLLHSMLMAFSVASVAIGAWEAWSGVGTGEVEVAGRFGGLLGANSLGLVSGLLVLYASIKRSGRSPPIRGVALLIAGLFGLFLAKSVSSVLATGGSVAVYIAAVRFERSSTLSVFRWITIGALTTIMLALAVWVLRRGDVADFLDASGGSFTQRLMIADAGLRIFLNHPLLGVGWHASASAEVIGSPTLNAVLMQSFMKLPTHYFFLEQPTSLHNMYIQFLAELGILGFILFVRGSFLVGKAVKTILRNIPAESPYKLWAQFYALGLVFLLIWWNTNPLFGGQTESILAFTFLAVLAAIARLERQRVGQTNGEIGGIG
jgi:O-antigen ligase